MRTFKVTVTIESIHINTLEGREPAPPSPVSGGEIRISTSIWVSERQTRATRKDLPPVPLPSGEDFYRIDYNGGTIDLGNYELFEEDLEEGETLTFLLSASEVDPNNNNENALFYSRRLNGSPMSWTGVREFSGPSSDRSVEYILNGSIRYRISVVENPIDPCLIRNKTQLRLSPWSPSTIERCSQDVLLVPDRTGANISIRKGETKCVYVPWYEDFRWYCGNTNNEEDSSGPQGTDLVKFVREATGRKMILSFYHVGDKSRRRIDLTRPDESGAIPERREHIVNIRDQRIRVEIFSFKSNYLFWREAGCTVIVHDYVATTISTEVRFKWEDINGTVIDTDTKREGADVKERFTVKKRYASVVERMPEQVSSTVVVHVGDTIITATTSKR